MKKGVIILTVISLILITTILAVVTYSQIPNPGHGGENVYIFINNTSMTLQTAITKDMFKNCSVTGGQYANTIISGHNASEIIVNVAGIVKTLQQALNDKSILSADNINNAPADYSGYSFPPQYQTANKIKVINKSGNEEQTLQYAIRKGWFVCVPEVVPPTAECLYNYDTSRLMCWKYEDAAPGGGTGMRSQWTFAWNSAPFIPYDDTRWETDYNDCANKERIKDGYRYFAGADKGITYTTGGYPEHRYEICREPIIEGPIYNCNTNPCVSGVVCSSLCVIGCSWDVSFYWKGTLVGNLHQDGGTNSFWYSWCGSGRTNTERTFGSYKYIVGNQMARDPGSNSVEEWYKYEISRTPA